MKLKVKKLYNDSKLPNRAYKTDSGLDVYAYHDEIVPSGKMKPIRTGITIQLPEPMEISVLPTEVGVSYRQTIVWECQVRPKSGLAMKHGITVLNTPGTVDSSYRGEIIVLLQNHGDNDFMVEKGMKIAQLVVSPVSVLPVEEIFEVNNSDRGDGGFGSTGK